MKKITLADLLNEYSERIGQWEKDFDYFWWSRNRDGMVEDLEYEIEMRCEDVLEYFRDHEKFFPKDVEKYLIEKTKREILMKIFLELKEKLGL